MVHSLVAPVALLEPGPALVELEVVALERVVVAELPVAEAQV